VGWLAREEERGILEEIIFDWQEKQMREALKEGLESLPERMCTILRCYYGLDGNVPQTLAEVGEGLDLSHEGVRRLRNKCPAATSYAALLFASAHHLREKGE
jgi:DNA-directed RNA polymerase sigma subunit (sigma70/sigma32)